MNPTNRIHQAELARSYNNLGYLLLAGKDWLEAEKCYQDAITIQQKLVDASPLAAAYRRDLTISLNNLGMVQSRNGQFDPAASSFRVALRLQQALMTHRGDPTTLSNCGSIYNNLGLLFEAQQRYADAEDAFRQAVSLQQQAHDAVPKNTRFAALLAKHSENLSSNLVHQGKSTKLSITSQRP